MTRLTEDERAEIGRLFGWVPEPEPLDHMLTAIERILTDRLAAHEAREADLTAAVRALTVRVNTAEPALETALVALEAGDACGHVGCRALAERNALRAAVDRVRRRHPRGDEESNHLAPGLWCPTCGNERSDNGYGGCPDRRALTGGQP
jgi:hypothetical protein